MKILRSYASLPQMIFTGDFYQVGPNRFPLSVQLLTLFLPYVSLPLFTRPKHPYLPTTSSYLQSPLPVFQLPPVEQFKQDSAEPDFAFNALCWNKMIPPENCRFLENPYRQKDPKFANILNRLRFGLLTEEDIAELDKRVTPAEDIPSDCSELYVYYHAGRSSEGCLILSLFVCRTHIESPIDGWRKGSTKTISTTHSPTVSLSKPKTRRSIPPSSRQSNNNGQGNWVTRERTASSLRNISKLSKIWTS